ncbi:MAG: LysR family transcriptional regulator [Gammaproteobacteria bacterium]|nr:LysR family transcriptional regulator [Gammaproteobacteria bacterium]
MRTRDLRLLAYFTQIVETGSVRGAAERLNVSAPVVSKALADLEQTVGVNLFKRAHNTITPTREGEAVYRHAQNMTHAAEQALRSVENSAGNVSGTVSITTSSEVALSWLPSLLREFARHYPAVTISLHAVDEVVDIASSDHDMAIRALYVTDDDPRPEQVARLGLELVCAPQLIAPSGSSLRQRLSRIPYIGYAREPDTTSLLAFNRRSGKPTEIPVTARFLVNNGYTAAQFARLGFGAAFVLEPSVRDDLASGKLVRVSDQHHFGQVAVSLHLRDRLPSLATKTFESFIRERAESGVE